jgi:outer membrane receptor protein involved in Fe transport
MIQIHLRSDVLIAAGLVLFASIFPRVALGDDVLGGSTSFDIPAQPLRSALIEFSQQADVQIMGSSDLFGEMQSTAVKGTLRGSVALRMLLQNTGLRYEAVRHAVVVRPIANARIRKDGAGVEMSPPTVEMASGSSRPIHLLVPLGEMTITGTHIRGGDPIGSQLIVLDRQALDQAGYATVQDVIRSLPQNFGGGPSEDTINSDNVVRGTGINLRGLGVGSTLVLLNGRRLALGGATSSFVDVSSIPLAAVARVEVLTDGASAIYGSDAVGGVVNFIMRDDYEGAESQAHYGAVTTGPLQETDVSQLLGTSWDSGHATFSYEYYHRGSLPAADREQTADSDLRRFGGGNFSSPQSNPGTVNIGGRQYAIPRNQNGTALTPDAFVPNAVNWQNQNEDRDLYGSWWRHSGFFSVAQSLGDDLTVSSDMLFSKRKVEAQNSGAADTFSVPASNPFRVLPAGAAPNSPYFVQYNLGRDLGPRTFDAEIQTLETAFGARLKLSHGWELNGTFSYGAEDVTQVQGNNYSLTAVNAALADPDPATALNLFGDGSFTNPATLARIRRSTLFTSDSDVTGFNLIANGGLLSLPAGEMRLAAGADYREQVFRSRSRGREATVATVSPRFERNVSAAFAELLVPVVSHANRLPGVEMVQLSLAARYDRYNDFGSTFNPRFGAEWSPLDGVVVHGGWGTSFKAPNLPDLDENQVISYIVSLPDPQSPTGRSPVLAWLGENRDLKPESATTWSAGIKWSPDLAWRPSFDLSYFSIHFKDRIQSAPLVDSFLTDPVRFAGIVTRNPTLAQRANVCSRGDYLGNFGTTPGDCLNAPIAAIVDARLNNTLESTTRGLDLLGTMEVDSDWGRFGFNSNVSYVLEFSEAQTPTVAAVSLVDTVSNPLRFKMRDSVSWNLDGLGAMATVNYAGSYRDNVSVPHRRVGSWTTLDLNLSYTVDVDTSGWLSGCTFSLNVQNLFDTDPPFVNNSAGVAYDRENADLLKRFVSLRVQKSW